MQPCGTLRTNVESGGGALGRGGESPRANFPVENLLRVIISKLTSPCYNTYLTKQCLQVTFIF